MKILLFFVMLGLAHAGQIVILSLGQDQLIQVYSLNPDDGSLALKSSTETSGNPAAMCVAPDGRHLYVALKTSGAIAVYRIEANATLTLLGESIIGADPAFLTIHRSGKYLLSAYYDAGKVGVHRINRDGTLSAQPTQLIETDEKAHAIVFDPAGYFAYVPHTRPNAIFQFRFDPEDGKLTPAKTPKLEREENSGPRHLWFHPRNGHAYGSDEQGRGVTAYRMNLKSGSLRVLETLPSNPPADFAGKHSTSDIEVHPSGDFVFLANRGYNAIASFRVDPSGKLIPMQHTATEAVTRSFNISPDGKFLVAAGQNSGNLATFAVAKNGELTRLATTKAGKNPWWVTIIDNAPRDTKLALGQGTLSSEVTATTAFLQTRLTSGTTLDFNGDLPGASGVVSFEYATQNDFKNSTQSLFIAAKSDHDFIVRESLGDLQPNTLYYYRAHFGIDAVSAIPGPVGSFKTLPGASSEQPVRFIVGSCMNYNKMLHGKYAASSGPITATSDDLALGYPSFLAMQEVRPDFLVFTGDIVYYDNPYRNAHTLPELRICWHEQFRFPRMISFFQNTPVFWSKDDHDFRFNDSDNTTSDLPLPQTGIDLFREQLPVSAPDQPTYRTHRVNKKLQIWLTEGRDFRSPNHLPDGPEKTLWGATQLAWLKRTLKESDAQFKILISPTPLIGPDDAYKKDNHANLAGFRHEADAFFQWLTENDLQDLTVICGDRHWQYHSIHPSGVQEFACGALNDENSRMGVPPGDKKGTDPGSLIKQPFISPKPAGGFLIISADESLSFEHRDSRGKTLYQFKK